MRKLSTFFLLFLSCAFASFGQSVVQKFIVNNDKIESGYITEKVWLQNFAAPDIKLLSPHYELAKTALLKIDANKAENIEIALGMERKRPFAFVSIPVFKEDPVTKEILQLKSFSLSIDEQPSAKPQFKTTISPSVLSDGDWYKIAVTENGVYKLDYSFIKSKLGVDPTNFDTRNFGIYGNGGVVMPEDNSIPVPDDLVENAIEVVDGGDNKLNEGDYILFYANGPLGWNVNSQKKTFYHQTNIYEDKSYYFITFTKGNNKRISSQPSAVNSNVVVNTFDERQVYEKELLNVGKLGKKWWGEDFGIDPGRQSSRQFSFNTGAYDSATFRVSLGSRSAAVSNLFTVKVNDVTTASYAAGKVFDEIPIISVGGEFKYPVSSGIANVQIEYLPGESNARGYLDYIEVVSRKSLALNNGYTAFRDWKSVNSGSVASFQVQNTNTNTVVWDVTDPLAPIRITGSYNSGTYTFANNAESLHEYIVFDGSNFRAPEFVKKIDNQNLHATDHVDYIIVTYPDFLAAANRLADFHRQYSNLKTVVVTTDQVYNEFGSGSGDIASIRNFARMLYKNAGDDTTKMPRYLLLLGDASYDYKNRLANNGNYVPTYETTESDSEIDGYCSDDFYAFLDDHENIEGILSSGKAIVNTMDLGVGRLPVTSADAANKLVDKIIRYASPASLGPWRLSTTIMADDGDGNVHFDDGEIMAATLNAHSNLYNENKVYISALPTVSTPGGLRCPDANKSINNQIYKGTFLMNYNGHGSITTLAHERILTQDDFNGWKNADKLPVVVTATCSFSKYDDPSYVSAGEQLIIKPDGGAIAMLTTTQLVYQYLNRDMNVDFINAFFRKYNGKWPTFGDAFRIGKNTTYVNPNNGLGTLGNFRKFALLGDPALTPAFPRYNVHTEAIINGYTQQPVDTLKALGKYQISGSVKDEAGQVLNDFNGRVYVTIYDKVRVQNTITGPAKTFKTQNSVIYKGKATVTNGLFSFTFIAPKDINYEFGKGKISYYVENGLVDGAGSDTTLNTGGTSEIFVEDNDAPIVKPFMNDSLFKDGGITGSNSVLHVQLYDESGINVSGSSIGHDLTGVLDGDIANPYILNDDYETAPNDYKHGYVNFPINNLSEGHHSLRVKAWDMFNNSGEGTVNFVVKNGQVVSIHNLMNYPNPFWDKTHFVFEHNHPGELLTVNINIYSNSGYLVRTITEKFTPNGSRSNEIVWDGTDNNGAKLSTGLYVYKLSLATEKGVESIAYQKLVLIR